MSALLEIIESPAALNDEMVVRVPDQGTAETVLGSQLIVQQSQEAVFFKDGQALDLFGPGRYTLSTKNLPLLNKLVGLPFGGKSPFRTAVVFISKKTFIDLKWGTREPVAFQDPQLGPVRLRAHGVYAMKIKESRRFVEQMVGTRGQFQTEDIAGFFRELIVSRFNDLLGEKLSSVLQLPAQYDELSAEAKLRIAPEFANYGVELTAFYVGAITPPDEVQARIDERAAIGALGNLDDYVKFRAAQALTDAARQENGISGSTVGIGLGAALGAMVPGIVQAGTQSRAAMAPCAGCRAAVPPGAKFCPQCGGKV